MRTLCNDNRDIVPPVGFTGREQVIVLEINERAFDTSRGRGNLPPLVSRIPAAILFRVSRIHENSLHPCTTWTTGQSADANPLIGT